MKQILEFFKNIKDFLDIFDLPIKILGLLSLLLSVLNFYIKQDYPTFLNAPISISVLTLALIISISVFFTLLIMNISLKLQKKLLIKNAYDIWKRLKKSIRDYHSSADISIQEKASIQYLYCREKLKEIMSIKEQELHSSLVEKYPNKPIGLINQMKSCYAASSLGKWKNYCKINLEEELDCFDEFLLWIKNN